MKLIAEIPMKQVDFVWVSNHWNVHLDGLCRYKGELCRFTSDGEIGYLKEEDYPTLDDDDRVVIDIYKIYSLNWYEKLKWMKRKKTFESCVGHHWTYVNEVRGPRYIIKYPRWLHNLILSLYYRKFIWH